MEIEAQAPGKLGQFARRLGRISAITRFFGGAAVFLGVAVMMYGCSRLDHRTDDAVGFGSLGLGMAALGTLVWSIGTFHGTFALAMGRVASIDDRLDETLKLFRRLEQRAAQPLPTPPPAHVVAGATEPAPAIASPPAAEDAPPPKPKGPPPPPPPRLCLKCGATLRPEVTRCRECMTKTID